MSEAVVLVTGGTGFAGSHLVEALLAEGITPHVTTASNRESFVTSLLPADHIHLVDLTDQTATFEVFARLQPTQIYHLAAFAIVGSSFAQGKEVLENNLKLQLNVMEAIKQYAPAARTLVVGSAMEYDTFNQASDSIDENHPLGPISPYAVSKVIQEMLGYSYGFSYKLDVVRARPFNHTGERQTADFAIPAFAQQIVAVERGELEHLSVGNLDAIRDFTDVKDVARAYLQLMATGKRGETYNIGSGQGHSMMNILEQLSQLSTASIRILQDPAKMRPLDVPSVVANISKISQLGWQPQITLQQTLQRVIEYWRHTT
jgi:GDP-4-dehydro-6-deoxy-D-mannose reductase